MQLQICY